MPIRVTPDKHIRRGGSQYAEAFASLLPQGIAWPREPTSVLMHTVRGLGEVWGNWVDRRAADLLEQETDPRKTIELLEDWERAWGMPDDCFFGIGLTVAERRKYLLMKMTLKGGQSRAWFIWVCAQLGYKVSITEFAPFMVGVSSLGDTRVHNSNVPGSLTGVLLHFDGHSGSSSFIDSGGKGYVIARTGNVTIDSSQSVFGGTSALFDGASGYLRVRGATDEFAFGAGDFTIEARIRLTSANPRYRTIFSTGEDWEDTVPLIDFYVDMDENRLAFWIGDGPNAITGPVLSNNVWYHVALIRRSAVTRMYVNGVQQGADYADTNSYTVHPDGPLIGGYGAHYDLFSGWMDEVRIIRDYAAYTTNFNLPSVAYTELPKNLLTGEFGVFT